MSISSSIHERWLLMIHSLQVVWVGTVLQCLYFVTCYIPLCELSKAAWIYFWVSSWRRTNQREFSIFKIDIYVRGRFLLVYLKWSSICFSLLSDSVGTRFTAGIYNWWKFLILLEYGQNHIEIYIQLKWWHRVASTALTSSLNQTEVASYIFFIISHLCW